jgi:hypothetical protein
MTKKNNRCATQPAEFTSTRNAVETAIDLAKEDKTLTWNELLGKLSEPTSRWSELLGVRD